MSSDIDKEIENLKADLNNLKLKLSECRKNGSDTKIAELKLMNVPFKIKLVEATQSYKDIDMVKKMLEDVKRELSGIIPNN